MRRLYRMEEASTVDEDKKFLRETGLKVVLVQPSPLLAGNTQAMTCTIRE